MENKTLEQRVKDELTPVDAEELYIESLDSEGAVTAGGLEFYPSKILSECDPIAYRCGLNDFLDYLSREREYAEIDGELYLTSEVDEIEQEGD